MAEPGAEGGFGTPLGSEGRVHLAYRRVLQ